MSKIERFENIKAWQKARELSTEIYTVTNKGMFVKDFLLKDQKTKITFAMKNLNHYTKRQKIYQKCLLGFIKYLGDKK